MENLEEQLGTHIAELRVQLSVAQESLQNAKGVASSAQRSLHEATINPLKTAQELLDEVEKACDGVNRSLLDAQATVRVLEQALRKQRPTNPFGLP